MLELANRHRQLNNASDPTTPVADEFQIVHLTYSFLIMAWFEAAFFICWAFQLKRMGFASLRLVGLLAGSRLPVFLFILGCITWEIHSVAKGDIGSSRTWRTPFGIVASLAVLLAMFCLGAALVLSSSFCCAF